MMRLATTIAPRLWAAHSPGCRRLTLSGAMAEASAWAVEASLVAGVAGLVVVTGAYGSPGVALLPVPDGLDVAWSFCRSACQVLAWRRSS
jgi:hypothetical protein